MSVFLLCLISAAEALEDVFVSGGLFFNFPFCQRWGNFSCNYAGGMKETGNLLFESCPFTAVQLWWCTNHVMQRFHQGTEVAAVCMATPCTNALNTYLCRRITHSSETAAVPHHVLTPRGLAVTEEFWTEMGKR